MRLERVDLHQLLITDGGVSSRISFQIATRGSGSNNTRADRVLSDASALMTLLGELERLGLQLGFCRCSSLPRVIVFGSEHLVVKCMEFQRLHHNARWFEKSTMNWY